MTYIREDYPTHHDKTDKEARRERNARARQLRKEGYTVTCKMFDFTDLARCRDYILEARRD